MAIDRFPLINSTEHFMNPGIAQSGADIVRPAQKSRPSFIGHSIFHEPWWLDIATSGNWHLVKVVENNEVIGEMPYTLVKKGFWKVSEMPPLTRCLGPVIRSSTGHAEDEWRHRFNVCDKLIRQLPGCDLFEQLLDPDVSEAEAIAFTFNRFTVLVNFTLRIFPQQTEPEVWARMRANTRNVIRRASEQLSVKEILDADEFVRFYDANLAARQQRNIYGSAVMRALLAQAVGRDAGKMLGCYSKDGVLQAEIAVVFDDTALYYLLCSRRQDTHGGAVSLLIWSAIRLAHERQLVFDFDGVSSQGILTFLSGFGGKLVRRFEIRRLQPGYATFRRLYRNTQSMVETAANRLQRAKGAGAAPEN